MRRLDLSEGRGIAYVGLGVGITASVAGNVAHAYVPPAGVAPPWTPSAGLVGSAVLWPVVLFLTLETMLSTRWPRTWLLVAVRWGALGTVALVSAVVSYQHLSGLLRHWHESEFAWRFGPLAVDGLLTMSATALVVLRTRRPADVPAPALASAVPPTATADVPPTDDDVPTTTDDGRRTDPPLALAPPPLSPTARTVLDALPGTTAELVRRTGVKRTSVDYLLANPLAPHVRRDDRKVWRRRDRAATG